MLQKLSALEKEPLLFKLLNCLIFTGTGRYLFGVPYHVDLLDPDSKHSIRGLLIAVKRTMIKIIK
jgi:hypothetical protein